MAVIVTMMARVAFSTHRMCCTGNTRRRRWGRGGRVHRPRRLVRLAPVEPFSFSPALSLLASRLSCRFFIASFPLSFRCQCTIAYSSRYAIACCSTNGGRRNPRDKPRRYNARAIYGIYRPWSPLSSREARPLSVRREVSISRSLVRMPFPRHCRRRNAVFANLGALHPVKPISGSPSCYRASIRTSFRFSPSRTVGMTYFAFNKLRERENAACQIQYIYFFKSYLIASYSIALGAPHSNSNPRSGPRWFLQTRIPLWAPRTRALWLAITASRY